MKKRFLFRFVRAAVLSCAAALFVCPDALAQASRIKARLARIDGDVLTLELLAKAGASAELAAPGADAANRITVTLLPDTRYATTASASLSALKAGDYAGAAVDERRGRLQAQEVFIYPENLRGTGEGRFPDNGRLMINGTVSAVQPPAREGRDSGTMTLHYRGAVISQAGQGRTLCEGRAAPPALMSALACAGDAVIEVPAGTPVSALTIGDRNLLAPGAILTVSLARDAGGRQVTPGVIVEKPQPPQ